jgi:gluconate 2-dehydrogenase subunit 3-like protein
MMAATRRSALKTIASAIAVPACAQHQHTADKLVQVAIAQGPFSPRFFTAREFAILEQLVDLIIPRTETPGASDAGVARIIDSGTAQSARQLQRSWRTGIDWADKQARAQFNKLFVQLSPADQAAILRRASEETGTDGAQFFDLLKSSTIDAYYTTREGLVLELGWSGNTYLPEFKGCTHPEHQG